MNKQKIYDGLNRFFENRVRKTAIAVALLLFLALGGCIYAMVDAKVFTRMVSAINSFGSLISMVFLLVLFVSAILLMDSSIKIRENFKLNVLFLLLIVFGYLADAIGLLAISYQGTTGHNRLLTVSTTISYVFMLSFWLAFWHYQNAYMKENAKFANIFIGVLTVISLTAILINPYTKIIFYVDENGTIIFNQNDIINTLIMLTFMVFDLVYILTRKCKKNIKVSLIPFVVFVFLLSLQNFLLINVDVKIPLDSLSYLELALISYFVFFNLQAQQRKDYVNERLHNIEMKNSIMLSQMRPHFIYNTLATISALSMKENAPKTQEMIDNFAQYLRGNMESLEFKKLIPFEEELNHIKTYLAIEQVRYGDELRVVYDVKFTNFCLPPLTVQPLVENAVKHGLFKKETGGTLYISTEQVRNNVEITVKDDGVGFDVNQRIDDGKQHIGISNIRNRLELSAFGELKIDSKKDEGTTAVVKIFGGGYKI